MTDYKKIAAQLGRVRRAWKRTAALTGLAVTVLETIGLFALAIIIDLLFRPGQEGRIILFACVLATVSVQLVRQVLRPLFRRISDQQIALHIEENNPGFEGALIAAAEFGRKTGGDTPASIVGTILAEAERRAGRLNVRDITRQLNLRKYAGLACAAIAVYGGVSALFPQTVGQHTLRVATPWRVPDRPAEEAASTTPPPPPPITFTLSETNANVLRGSAFRLEAALSRQPESNVQIHFRSFSATATEARWYTVPMKSIEKVYAYEAVLPDVNEDMECYISAEKNRSVACQIRVYDPLTVDAVETEIHYPDYLARPDKTSRQANGDLAAPIGATATIRILANRPITSGQVLWDNGETLPLNTDTQAENTASASFAVTTNRTYRFRIGDNMGQVFESPAEAYVKALPDLPPALVLKRPVPPPESVTPLSELTLEAVVSDDFGLAGVDLVYRCSGETEGPEQRVPLAIATNDAVDGAEIPVSFLFQLENVSPTLKGGDVITWHLEARDRKQQTAVTDLVLTPVRHFDLWPTEMFGVSHDMVKEEPPSLAAILQSAFQLASRRAQLAPQAFETQSEDLAQTMVNPTTRAVWVFVEILPETPPENIKKIKKINAWAVEGHDALAAHRIDDAVEVLRRAVTLMIAMGLLEDPMLERMPPQTSTIQPETSNPTQQQLESMATLEKQLTQEAKQKPKEQQQQTTQAEQTEALQKKLAELAAQQKKEVQKTKELEKNAAEKNTQQKNAQQQAAETQKKLAETVKAEADNVQKDTKLEEKQRQQTAQKMNEAARQMDQAAHEMKQGRVEQAAQAAEAALQKLTTARDELTTTNQDKITQELEKVEQQTAKALRRQNELTAATEKAAQQQKTQPKAAQQRMQETARQQAALKADLDDIQTAVNALKQAVDNGLVKPETAKHIQNAERELRRGRPAQKAANAAVALNAQNAADAKEAQKQVAEALEKAHASLRQASDSTATGFEAELKRARNEAQQAEQQVKQLQTQPQTGTQTPQERQAQAEEALDTAARLARHIEARDFVAAQTAQALNKELPPTPAGGSRIETDKNKAMALAAAISQVRSELDQAYDKLQENKRLFSSQREECPPQYRPLVNQYFEALSGGKPNE